MYYKKDHSKKNNVFFPEESFQNVRTMIFYFNKRSKVLGSWSCQGKV